MKINAIKANGVEYDIWATESDVQALNNQGNAALGKELESGKVLIAQAINNKGGEASADESLSELADDITNTISGEDFLKKFLEGTSPYDSGTFTSNAEYLDNYKLYTVPFTEIYMPNLLNFAQYNFRDCPNLRVLRLSSFAPVSIADIQGFLYNNPTLEELYFDSFNYNVGQFMRWCNSPIKKIYAPNWSVNFSVLGGTAFWGDQGAVRTIEDLTIKSFYITTHTQFYRNDSVRRIMLTEAPTADINFRYLWTCDNIIAEGQSGIDELNANVQALADSFLDYTGLTAKIITFNTNLYNVLTEATKQKFTDKNWAVAYA